MPHLRNLLFLVYKPAFRSPGSFGQCLFRYVIGVHVYTRGCILWDLRELSFFNKLRIHVRRNHA
jgi:hypothetical protein